MRFKKFCIFFVFVLSYGSHLSAQSSYYFGVDFTQSGLTLKDELAAHIISTHNNTLTYDELWFILGQTDAVPGENSEVFLVYGSDDTDNEVINDLTRNKFQHGGSIGDWNREHVYPRSLGTPNLGTSGPGSDAHHIRPCDMQMNSTRNNHAFADGTGIATRMFPGWYPGDQWKGDCARIVLYLYLRYGNRCLPSNVGIGETNPLDINMINLFLEWNADDPVSAIELNRNNVLENFQGNRNPFIDNPALATIIWGGPEAQDTWNLLGDKVTLNLKAILEGAYLSNEEKMSDLLRMNNYLPITEPYSSLGYNVETETTDASIFNVTGDNAIVDWVLVELRDPSNPSSVLASRVGLLQKDGDVVSANGTDDFTINIPSASTSAYVAIRHRNHFGVRTNNTYPLNAEVSIDFTDTTLALFGTSPVTVLDGKNMLIAGDGNRDGAINVFDNNFFWRIQNGIAFDYLTSSSDYNLDGIVNIIDRNFFWRVNNSSIQSLE